MFIHLSMQLLPLLNPILMFVVLLSMLSGVPIEEKQRIIIRECIFTCFTMLLIAYCGQSILSSISVSVAAVRLSGGIMLFISALRILEIIPQPAGSEVLDIGVLVPITMPLFVGPGIISTLVSWSSTYSFLEMAPAIVAKVSFLCITLLILFTFCLELKSSIIKTLSSLSGLILSFLSAEMIINSLKTLST